MQPGQSLTTDDGRTEVLLTPGAFLRVDAHSTVTLISGGLTNTEVEVNRGRASVEVTEIRDGNNLRVLEDGVTTQLVKSGFYSFNAEDGSIRVYKGKAIVQDGDRPVEVKGGRVVTLNGGAQLKAQKFDKNQYQDDFYQWSKLRSEYLAEANVSAAQIYVNGGAGWYGPGWYWNPWFGSYTFIPGSGLLYSPFGWGFYSPGLVYGVSPYYYGGTTFRRYVPAIRPGVSAGVPRLRSSGGFSHMGRAGMGGSHGGGHR